MEKKEFFRFEADFVDAGIRCIPMIVRWKLDLVGVKMLLSTWVRCSFSERQQLVSLPCSAEGEKELYRAFLFGLSEKYTGRLPAMLAVPASTAWEQVQEIPADLQAQAAAHGWSISLQQWARLSLLQRFALLKLCRPGHENRNFPLAMVEFGWPAVEPATKSA